jgi:hypothetical protein
MSTDARLSPKTRRTVLEQLSRERLAELAERFALDVPDRRSIDAHIDAIVRKRSLDFGKLLDALQRDELKAACEALGLEARGREKAPLVQCILGRAAPTAGGVGSVDDMGDAPSSKPSSNAPPPISVGSTRALKSDLRRFVLDVAGGYKGKDAASEFTRRLLQCFGWPDGHTPDAMMPADLAIVGEGARTTKPVALLWNARRVLIDVVKHDVMLDFAWKSLLRACLQLDPVPQYVILTNQRDLQLYDIGRDREAARLSIAVDDLPKYSEAFPFLSTAWIPGTLPKIINVSKVSREVAELVARLYTSLREQHPEQEREVVQFTLQCILTMFAEDIGLLPPEYFTTLLYDGARRRDVEARLRELFRLMSTRDVPSPRAIPFFNGGLFSVPVTLALGDAQLAALTKASEANWAHVDPHIFGSVFQGIMNDAERHKSGAHYTVHEDIMRVVGPTIVEPWRQRIRDAKTLADLLEVRAALLQFRVLDPACGSGNFLYVAFRELYRLDTELLARMMREFPSTQGQGRAKMTWGAGIQTSNFFGMDINPFAVELAKVTLNIAKKIAFDERRAFAADIDGQLELDVDPSLPLDNLEKNIVRADALFTDWPEVDAIVGNPPFLGGLKVRNELGLEYLRRLQARFPEVNGRADFCAYWFRLAQDRLASGGRAGLIGTNSIRDGRTREASIDYVVARGGTITNAVSSREWPGEAAVKVSMVNWIKGPTAGLRTLVVDEHVYEVPTIAPHLQLHPDLGGAQPLKSNTRGTSQGMVLGTKLFELEPAEAKKLVADPTSAAFVRAVADATRLFTGRLENNPNFAVDMSGCETEAAAKKGGKSFDFLEATVHPYVRSKGATYEGWEGRWWQPWRPREEFFRELGARKRLLVCSRHAARSVFVFIAISFLPTESLQLFALDDDYSFGVMQSELHWRWALSKGTKMKEDTRYTVEVWSTFPWPQEASEGEVAAVADASRNLRRVREDLMRANNWSLRALYQAAEVAGTHPLKDAQLSLDRAVRNAYQMPADQEATEFLLELNHLVAQDEAEGRDVQGPGLPRGLDPLDGRWTSQDCIQPPTGR